MAKTHKRDKNSEPKKKHKHKKEHKEKRSKKLKKSKKQKNEELPDKPEEGDFAIPVELMNNKSHAPETPEEFKRRSEAIRKEVDPTTGRTRIIRGDSEVIEEIVSKDRHASINKAATEGDGRYFQEQTMGKKAKR